jgi:hypothetical protein
MNRDRLAQKRFVFRTPGRQDRRSDEQDKENESFFVSFLQKYVHDTKIFTL